MISCSGRQRVFLGLMFGQPMDLAFKTFEVAAVALAVGIASSIVTHAESNWSEGTYLPVLCGMLAVAFYSSRRRQSCSAGL